MIGLEDMQRAVADHDAIAEEHATPVASAERAGVDWPALEHVSDQRATRVFCLMTKRPFDERHPLNVSALNEQERMLLTWLQVLWTDAFLTGVECEKGVGAPSSII